MLSDLVFFDVQCTKSHSSFIILYQYQITLTVTVSVRRATVASSFFTGNTKSHGSSIILYCTKSRSSSIILSSGFTVRRATAALLFFTADTKSHRSFIIIYFTRSHRQFCYFKLPVRLKSHSSFIIVSVAGSAYEEPQQLHLIILYRRATVASLFFRHSDCTKSHSSSITFYLHCVAVLLPV